MFRRLHNSSKDMTEGSPLKLILTFAIPMLIGNIFQQFYNMVDAIVVGRYEGENALAAVGTSTSPNFLIFSLIVGLSTGLSIIISQYYGAKDYENVRKTFATASFTIFGAALLMSAIGFFAARPILIFLNAPANVLDDATLYMKISSLGIIGVSFYNMIASTLRALGDSITPLLFLILASIMNAVLDILFVYVFHMGVAGVAIATIIAQISSALGCIIYAFKKMTILRLSKSEFRPDKAIFKKCIKLGLPVALQNSFIACSNMALQGIINGYGESYIAANVAENKIDSIVYMPSSSLGMALSTFAGQNVGAGKPERVKQGFRAAMKIIIGYCLFMTLFMYFASPYLVRIFTKSDFVVELGTSALRITCFFYLFVSTIFISRSLLSGAGDVKVPMVMGISEVVCRYVFATILTATSLGYLGIYVATAINWTVTSAIGMIRYLSGKWKLKGIVNTNHT